MTPTGEGGMRPRSLSAARVLLVLLTAGWGVFGYYQSKEKRYRADLGQAKSDLAAGRLSIARAQLARPGGAGGPTDGEAAYYLGRCEEGTRQHRGRLAAWEQVPAELAVRNQGRGGRAPARCSTPASSARPKRSSKPFRASTGPECCRGPTRPSSCVYRFQGRMQEFAVDHRVVERRRSTRPRSSGGSSCSNGPSIPAEMVGNLLADCRPRRRPGLAGEGEPGDPERADRRGRSLARPVQRHAGPKTRRSGSRTSSWRGPRATPRRLPRDGAPSGPAVLGDRTTRLRVWFAARPGDPEREAGALEALVAEDPGDTAAWDRLAELALSAATSPMPSDFDAARPMSSTLTAQYSKLIDRDDRAENAGELATLGGGTRTEGRSAGLVARSRDGHAGAGKRSDGSDVQAESTDQRSRRLLVRSLQPAVPTPSVHDRRRLAGHYPRVPGRRRAAGLRFVYDNGHTGAEAPAARGDGGRSRPARFRR